MQDFRIPRVRIMQLWEMASELSGVNIAGAQILSPDCVCTWNILFFGEEERSLCSIQAETKFKKETEIHQIPLPPISSAVNTVLASLPNNNFDLLLKRRFEGLKHSFGKWKILSGPVRANLISPQLLCWNKLGHDVVNYSITTNNVNTINIVFVIHCILSHYFISINSSCCECICFYVVLNSPSQRSSALVIVSKNRSGRIWEKSCGITMALRSAGLYNFFWAGHCNYFFVKVAVLLFLPIIWNNFCFCNLPDLR